MAYNPAPMSDLTPALDIAGLSFRYGGNDGAAFQLDIGHLRLGRGEQMLLTGGSGSGKSTLLHLICGLMEPGSGEVKIGGQAIHALSGAARDRFRGQHVGMIFQNYNLLHGFSAAQNVMAALMFSKVPRGEHRAHAESLLKHLGIPDPRRDPDRLSIGQQQRVAVARAVACKPTLVLADEPSASLDPDNAGVAMDLIQQTCREHEAALLCVSHDPAMAERFDRRVAIEELSSTN